MASSFKEKITQGKPVLGTWHTTASPLIAETLAQAGLDFVIMDFEHGPYELGNVHRYVSAMASTPCAPIIRIPAGEPWMVLQALDQGAHGVMAPHVDTLSIAKDFVEAARYHPAGTRGYSPFTKAGKFHARERHTERSNQDVASIAIIESLEGFNALDEMLGLPELDIVYFGAYDLSQALGVPGESRHPKVVDLVKTGVEKVRRAKKTAGAFVAMDTRDIEWSLELGLRFITVDIDSHVLFQHFSKMAESLKALGKFS